MNRIFVVVIAVLMGSVAARAHDPGLSTTEVSLSSDAVRMRVGFAPNDLAALLRDPSRAAALRTPEGMAESQDQLKALAPRLWSVKGRAGLVAPHSVALELASGNSILLSLVYPRTRGADLELRASFLRDLPPGHRDFLSVTDEQGETVTEKLIGAGDQDPMISIPGLEPASLPDPGRDTSVEQSTFRSFIALGVRHIWTGYDHLLFLFGLLVVCRSFKAIVGVISCFTVAHSLTLGLSTLNAVVLSSRFVEPVIALSIAFVGVENLVCRGREPPGRPLLTFLFGLIHGFGFAGALRELGVGTPGHPLWVPLFSFNLGVELGQIAIAAAVLPLVWRWRDKRLFQTWAIPALSSIVGLAGVGWFLQRTLLA